jgi:hypothetical protein
MGEDDIMKWRWFIAIFFLYSGIALIRNVPQVRRLFFFTVGASFTATIGVLLHYALFDPKPMMLLLIAPMLVIEIIFTVKNIKGYDDLLHAVPGVVIYGALNMVGTTLQFGQTAMFGHALVMLFTALAFTALLFRRRLKLGYE